jgi:hypothetical protein
MNPGVSLRADLNIYHDALIKKYFLKDYLFLSLSLSPFISLSLSLFLSLAFSRSTAAGQSINFALERQLISGKSRR